MTASQPDACVDAASGQRVHYQVMPGLRLDGKVVRKCRVVLQPVEAAAAVPSDEGKSAAATGEDVSAAAAELPAEQAAAAPPGAADEASQPGE
jgi:hypothetical protein